jgi:protein-S-isoprenylcysteine O-methyltransferase Ste14
VSGFSLGAAVGLTWLAWLIYWYASARNLKPERWHESLLSGLGHRVPLILAAIIMSSPHVLPGPASGRFVPVSVVIDVVGVLLLLAGLGFSIAAKRQLGANWSAAVTVKENHSLIRTGPYRFVRHPIYTGIVVAFVGSALVIGEWRCVVAVLLVYAAFIYKSRIEERRMQENFSEYLDYKQHTSAIIPFLY